MRKRVVLSLALASILSVSVSAVDDQAIPDDALGLSKTSVYDVPDPDLITYNDGDPGSNELLATSYHTAPPMISHHVNDMLPITRESNLCKDCHVQPDLIGTKIEPGMPVPAPRSHYVNVKRGQLYMGRYNCVQCHAPQAKVDVLVKSTFKLPGKK